MLTFVFMATLTYLPIEQDDQLNLWFRENADCIVILDLFTTFYTKVGYQKPWIGYFAVDESKSIIGAAAFKGAPKDGKIEISYGVFDNHQRKGLGAELCRHLVHLARATDPSVLITARTLHDNAASIKVLEKNGFTCAGTVMDEEDGEVLEWVLR